MMPRQPPPPRPDAANIDHELAERTRRRVMNMETTPGDILVPLAGAMILFAIVILIAWGADQIFGTEQERWMAKCERHASQDTCLKIYGETK